LTAIWYYCVDAEKSIMKTEKRRNPMLVPTILMAIIAIDLYILALKHGHGRQTEG